MSVSIDKTSTPLSEAFNITQQILVLNALQDFAWQTFAPSLLLECFIIGVLFACVPLGTYLLWLRLRSTARGRFILPIWIIFAAFLVHWALALHQLESYIGGSALRLSAPPLDSLLNLLPEYNGLFRPFDLEKSLSYPLMWSVWSPLTTETVLMGLASALFVISMSLTMRQNRSHWRSVSAAIIPVLATIMYGLSLAHWGRYLHYCSVYNSFPGPLEGPLYLSEGSILVIFLALNTVLSDMIVLWRMCIVWDKSRWALVLAAGLSLVTFAFNVTNIVRVRHLDLEPGPNFYSPRIEDKEVLATFGQTSIGLAAAFMSLSSNVCATALVGAKAWMLKNQLGKQAHARSHRTFAQRVMELLVDSGIVYTVIWIVYCVSFFRPITTQTISRNSSGDSAVDITAASYLDAAMAQITTIYPLIIFILVALDKALYERGPRALHQSEGSRLRGEALTVTLDIDIERSAVLDPGVAYEMVEHDDGQLVLTHYRGKTAYEIPQ